MQSLRLNRTNFVDKSQRFFGKSSLNVLATQLRVLPTVSRVTLSNGPPIAVFVASNLTGSELHGIGADCPCLRIYEVVLCSSVDRFLVDVVSRWWILVAENVSLTRIGEAARFSPRGRALVMPHIPLLQRSCVFDVQHGAQTHKIAVDATL